MKLFVHGLFVSGLLFAVVILAGCDSLPARPGPSTGDKTGPGVARFRVGETVIVTMTTGSPDSDIPVHEEPIKEDGTITMPLIGKITAVGKTTGELQDESYYYYSGYYHDYYYSRSEDSQAAAAKDPNATGDTDRIGIKQKY